VIDSKEQAGQRFLLAAPPRARLLCPGLLHSRAAPMSSEPNPVQQPALRRMMRGREYFTLAFGSIVGVGWLVVIEDWLTRGGPLGAMLAYVICGFALIPVVLVYGRLARQMPEAASEIAYTGAVFPPAVSFATGWSMTFAYLVVCPYEAV